MLAVASVLERVIASRQDQLSPEVAKYILSLELTERDRERAAELAAKRQQNALSDDEKIELDDLLTTNDLLMILKSKARVSQRPKSPAA